ncbi:hypothetical protein HDU80_000196 [Chytriomyces hyalinus]|nr:hypothetical protein HDU80_000196 [Chytriomyces hyalinus]
MPVKWYLPVWKLKELEDCCLKCYPSIPVEQVSGRYALCGGVTQFVFNPDFDNIVPENIKVALCDMKVVNAVKYLGKPSHNFPHSDLLLHMTVGTDEARRPYQFLCLDVASKYIGQQLFKQEAAEMLENLQVLLGGSPHQLSPNLYELYAHHVFSLGGITLKCKNLTTGEISELE